MQWAERQEKPGNSHRLLCLLSSELKSHVLVQQHFGLLHLQPAVTRITHAAPTAGPPAGDMTGTSMLLFCLRFHPPTPLPPPPTPHPPHPPTHPPRCSHPHPVQPSEPAAPRHPPHQEPPRAGSRLEAALPPGQWHGQHPAGRASRDARRAAPHHTGHDGGAGEGDMSTEWWCGWWFLV